jgi:PAS domain S-box-containing protein
MSLDDEIKYRTLVETAPDTIFLIDLDSWRIRETNERVEDLLGYTESDLVGQSIERLHPDEDVDRYMEKFREAVREGSIQFSKFDDGAQVYLVAKDGSRVPVDIHANIVEGANGPILFGIARDITEMRRYENEIEQLAGELAVVNRLIRHDIRNDMAVIRGWLGQLKSKLDDTHDETLDLLLQRSESVVELTDTVKDYVEMLSGDSDPQLESVMIDEIVEKEATAAREAYDEAEMTVTGVPSQPVLANSMLASVFRNLFHNAVQHNDKRVPKVDVTAEERAETVVVHVADNGPGVPDERKSDIFGKGDKGLNSSGTGIGLFLVGKLIDQFGGDVRVSDNEPEGAVFSVELRKP